MTDTADRTLLENRDYTLIVDKSNSMSAQDQPGGKSRWDAARESTLALARECDRLDPDGITVYLFSSRFKRYDNVTAEKVARIYAENDPMGRSDLATVLQDALENYFQRKAAGVSKPNGETLLIITDGEPDDRKAVIRTLVEASRKIDRDEELGISFIQVGDDPKVTEFFRALDDQLAAAGARFDIVDTVTIEEIGSTPLPDVLLDAVLD